MTPDLCVIGGGTAGHAVALAAAAIGARCTLVDPRERLGVGQAADLADAMLVEAARAHVSQPGGRPPFDMPGFRRRLGQALADLAPTHAAERLRTLGVTVVRAEGVFADARTLLAGETAIRARRFVLATGARPALPAWASTLEPDHLLGHASLVKLAAIPASVAVVAQNASGLVWAQVLARLGASVTLVAAPGVIAPFDPEAMEPVFAALRSDGVVLYGDHVVRAATPSGSGLTLEVHPQDDACTGVSVAATHVLIAGRAMPSISGLGLERAGIACEDGRPVVNRGLRTGNPRVLAIGDVLGDDKPGGAAIPHQVGLVLRAALFRQPVRYDPDRVPVALRTSPAVAQVGSLDAGPRRAGTRILRWPLADTADGLSRGAPSGGVRIATDAGGRIRGVAIVGPTADEAIVPWALAMAHALPVSALATLPAPATGLNEASRRAGLGLLAARLGSPWVKRLLALSRLLP